MSARDDHVRLEASEFVVQFAEGGGAHAQRGTQVAYGPDEDVPVQVAEVLEGNQYPHGGSGLGVGSAAHVCDREAPSSSDAPGASPMWPFFSDPIRPAHMPGGHFRAP